MYSQETPSAGESGQPAASSIPLSGNAYAVLGPHFCSVNLAIFRRSALAALVNKNEPIRWSLSSSAKALIAVLGGTTLRPSSINLRNASIFFFGFGKRKPARTYLGSQPYLPF